MSTSKEFEEFFHDEGFRVKYATEFKTLTGNGGEGGRQDVLFYIHDEDVKKFAMYRLKREGMSWWEDAIDNENKIFPERILDKYEYSWNCNIQKWFSEPEKDSSLFG